MDGSITLQLGSTVEDVVADESDIDVYCWRMEQLLLAGYSHLIAGVLAGKADVDLHVACTLLEAGCPEKTAFLILY